MFNTVYLVHNIFTQSVAEIFEQTSYDKLMYFT